MHQYNVSSRKKICLYLLHYRLKLQLPIRSAHFYKPLCTTKLKRGLKIEDNTEVSNAITVLIIPQITQLAIVN